MIVMNCVYQAGCPNWMQRHVADIVRVKVLAGFVYDLAAERID